MKMTIESIRASLLIIIQNHYIMQELIKLN